MKLTRYRSRAVMLTAGLAMTFANIAANADTHRVTLPVGTVIPVKLDQSLSSKNSQPGDKFTATVRYGRDDAGIPEGTRVEGIVREALPSGDGKPGVLDVDFRTIVFPGGDRRPIEAGLYSLDGKSVKSSDGRLVATADKSKDRLKWVGIGAGAGLVIGTLTKGNALVDTLLGAGAGFLANEFGNKKPGDVNLKSGSEFGVRLDRQVAFNQDDRNYYRSHNQDNPDRIIPGNQNGGRTGGADDKLYGGVGDDRNYNRNDVRNSDARNRDDLYYRNGDTRASGDIGLMIDDREVRFRGSKPFTRNGIVFVPLEAVSRAANFDYRYDPQDKIIRANNNSIKLSMDSRIAFVNGERRRLPAAAEIRNGIVYVPMQFIGWAAKGSSSWDSGSQTVVITTDRDRR
jgi:hypothetical protein